MSDNLLSQAEFIDLFPNTRFRYIHDVNKVVVQGSNMLDHSLNGKGYGVFFTVNGFPPFGLAKEAQLLSLNANYVDIDFDTSLSQTEIDGLIKNALMLGIESGIPAPTIMNRTKRGSHMIWLYPESISPTTETLTTWKSVQRRLVHCLKGDIAAVDPSRVLRLPYTMHLKNPSDPFEVTITSYKPEARVALIELDTVVPKDSEKILDNDKPPVSELLLNGVKIGDGMRHMGLAQIAGLALKGAKTQEDVDVARLAAYGWDRCIVKSPEPFDQRKKEIDDTVDSIWKLEREKNVSTDTKSLSELHMWTVGDILKHDFGEEEWVVDSLISKQGMTALSGNPGDFKTWVTIHIALCMSRNIPVFGKFKVQKGNVLIIDEEDHLRLLKKRLELLGAKDTDTIHYLSQNGIKMDVPAVRDAVLKMVEEKNIKLLILDSLVRVHGQDENDAKGMANVFNSLQKIIKAGASILFTHHHRKQMGFGTSNPGQSMRGSSDILAAVDCHVTVEKKKDETDRLIIRQTKLRQAEVLKPFEVTILKGEFGPSGFDYAGDHDEKKLKAEAASTAVVAVLVNGMKCRTDIIAALNKEFGKTATEEGIKIAEEAGLIEKVPKAELPKADSRKAFYRIPVKVSELPASSTYIGVEKQEDDLWPEMIPN